MFSSELDLIAINPINLFFTGTSFNRTETVHGRRICRGLDDLLDCSIDLRLGNRTSYLLGNFTFLKDDQSGNGPNAVLGWSLRAFIHVTFADFEATFVLSC